MRKLAAFGLTVAIAFNAKFAIGYAEPLPPATNSATYLSIDEAKARLGQSLFYDRVLSGTYLVSCATCHNHDRGSSNGYRLDGAGEANVDELATNGASPWAPFQPSSRHAPALFNLGALEFQTLFSDGRVRAENEFLIAPAHSPLPKGIDSVLAAQVLFPTITGDELTGTAGSDLAAKGNEDIWKSLVSRIANLPEYLPLFQNAYRDVKQSDDIRIDHIAKAIAAFVSSEWRSDGSPFDAHLRGVPKALSDQQRRGMVAFYGKAGCSNCHAGTFQTDHQFHHTNVTRPGDGGSAEKGNTPRWRGRFNVTGWPADLGKIRTPSLRNVGRTAPYGLVGQYEKLGDVIAAHGKTLPASTMDDLVSFLNSLTDEAGLAGRLGKPDDVPSSLSLD